MTKKQTELYNSYVSAYVDGPKTELYQVYGKFSQKKVNALNYCRQLQSQLDGFNATIVSANSYIFTYAFQYYDEELGETCLCFITPSNDYKFSIE